MTQPQERSETAVKEGNARLMTGTKYHANVHFTE